MKLWWRLAIAGLAIVWLGGFASVARTAAQAQLPAPPAGKKAGEVFKNVTTSTLKELTTDDFLWAMGTIADDLGLDCADCHPNAGTDQVDWVIDTRQKRTARRMVEMVATINKTNFAGVQKVTCWTCHHGRDVPASTIALDTCTTRQLREHDVVKAETDGPTATQILDKHHCRRRRSACRHDQCVDQGEQRRIHGVKWPGDFRSRQTPNLKPPITFKDHPDRGETPGRRRDERLDENALGLFSEVQLVGASWHRLSQLAFPADQNRAD